MGQPFAAHDIDTRSYQPKNSFATAIVSRITLWRFGNRPFSSHLSRRRSPLISGMSEPADSFLNAGVELVPLAPLV